MKIYSKNRTYPGSNPQTNGEILLWKFIQENFNPKIVFDVGVESYSHLIDYAINKKINFWLFEPNIDFFNILKNKYSSFQNIIIENYGLGENCEEEIKLYPSTGSIFLREKTIANLKKDFILIKTKTIDNFLTSNSIEKIDFLKIDVEGYELNILKGAKNSLSKIDLIQFEYGGCFIDAGIKLEEILSFFTDRFIYAIEPTGLNERSIIQLLEEENKNYLYTNFLVSKEKIQ
jgi:FkbM family methyltransferase